jgi:radical SAM protein with 4Fe4S-binding SPASM domain
MSWKMMKNILDWWLPMEDASAFRLFQFWGGEPLLEWDLIQKAIGYAEKHLGQPHGVEFGGTTNGMLYTPDKVEWGVEHNSVFLLSLDGIEQVHDLHRKQPSGKGSWKIVDRNTRAAIKIFPRQKIRCSLGADTIHHFLENVQYFVEDLGTTHFAFSPVFEHNWNEERLEVLAQQFELVTDYLIKKAKEGTVVGVKHLDDIVRAGDDVHEFRNPCGAGNTYIGFSVDGFAYPCHRFNKHGRTTKDRYADKIHIIEPDGDSFKWVNEEWRQSFIYFKDNHPDKCKECSIRGKGMCNGGCYAVNFDMTGGIHTQPKSVCDFNEVQMQAGLSYKQKLIDADLMVKKDTRLVDGCVCYNGCYMENTREEIIRIDRKNDRSCLCYNTEYSGPKHAQFRMTKELDVEKQAFMRVVNAAIKVMGDYDNEQETSNERTDGREDHGVDEQLLQCGGGKQGDGVQHSGTDKCSGKCGCNRVARGEDSEKVEED